MDLQRNVNLDRQLTYIQQLEASTVMRVKQKKCKLIIHTVTIVITEPGKLLKITFSSPEESKA